MTSVAFPLMVPVAGVIVTVPVFWLERCTLKPPANPVKPAVGRETATDEVELYATRLLRSVLRMVSGPAVTTRWVTEPGVTGEALPTVSVIEGLERVAIVAATS